MLSSNKRQKALSEMKKKKKKKKEEKETEKWERIAKGERSLFFGETNKR